MKKLGKFRIKYLRLCSKIIHCKYAHVNPRFLQNYLISHKGKRIEYNFDSKRYLCPFCHAFVKYGNDCKACGAVRTTSWWYRR